METNRIAAALPPGLSIDATQAKSYSQVIIDELTAQDTVFFQQAAAEDSRLSSGIFAHDSETRRNADATVEARMSLHQQARAKGLVTAVTWTLLGDDIKGQLAFPSTCPRGRNVFSAWSRHGPQRSTSACGSDIPAATGRPRRRTVRQRGNTRRVAACGIYPLFGNPPRKNQPADRHTRAGSPRPTH